ncbi:hypothetical protein D3C79_1102360 [compost metagenome]
MQHGHSLGEAVVPVGGTAEHSAGRGAQLWLVVLSHLSPLARLGHARGLFHGRAGGDRQAGGPG